MVYSEWNGSPQAGDYISLVDAWMKLFSEGETVGYKTVHPHQQALFENLSFIAKMRYEGSGLLFTEHPESSNLYTVTAL